MPFDLLGPGDWLRPPLCPTVDAFSSQVNVEPGLDVETYLDDSDSDDEKEITNTSKVELELGENMVADYLESNSLAQHVDEHFIENQDEYTVYVCMFRTQHILGPMFVQYALTLDNNILNAPSTKYAALRHPAWVPDTEGQDDVSDADQRQTTFINTCAAVVADTFPRAAMKMSYTQRFRGYVMHPDSSINCAYAFFDCTFDRISDALPAKFQWSVITDILDNSDENNNIDNRLYTVFKAVPELSGPEIKPTLLYFCRTPMVVGASNNMVVPHVYDPNIGRAHCFTRRKAVNSRRAAAFDPNIVSAGVNGERALVKSADNFVEI